MEKCRFHSPSDDHLSRSLYQCPSSAHAKTLIPNNHFIHFCSHHIRVLAAKLGKTLTSLDITCSQHKDNCSCMF